MLRDRELLVKNSEISRLHDSIMNSPCMKFQQLYQGMQQEFVQENKDLIKQLENLNFETQVLKQKNMMLEQYMVCLVSKNKNQKQNNNSIIKNRYILTVNYKCFSVHINTLLSNLREREALNYRLSTVMATYLEDLIIIRKYIE